MSDETPAVNAPGNVDHYNDAIESLQGARTDAVYALSKALTPEAHYQLSQVVVELTNQILRVENAKERDGKAA